MPVSEIEELKNQFVKQLSPIRIYLFGSFANGTNTENSDFDFYIVVNDNVTDLAEMTTNAYKAIRLTKQRPVDIIVGTRSRFDERKHAMSVENEVFEKGVLLYESGN
jgi:predicted nucleotidyltransferase